MCNARNTWKLMQVGEIPRMPLVLLGEHWHDILTRYYGDGSYIHEEYMSFYQVVDSPAAVIDALAGWKQP